MQDGMSEETFDYNFLQGDQKNDLHHPLSSLLNRNTNKSFQYTTCMLRAVGGPTKAIVRSLRDVGLPFTIHESSGGTTITFGEPYHGFGALQDLHIN
jgi:hypothetical protein